MGGGRRLGVEEPGRRGGRSGGVVGVGGLDV